MSSRSSTSDGSRVVLADLAAINAPLGRTASAVPLRSQVNGTNLSRGMFEDVIIERTLALGRMVSRLIAIDGTALNTGIGFASGGAGSGLHAGGGNICMAIGGVDISCWTPTGLAAAKIYGPAGTIDFGGSTLVNIAGIVINPGSYEVVGLPVTTVGAVTVNSLTVPTTPTTGLSANYDMVIKVIYVATGTGGVTNGVREFRTRVYQTIASVTPVVGAAYDQTIYEDAPLLGCGVSAVAVLGGNALHVEVTGCAGQTVKWQARAGIVKVES